VSFPRFDEPVALDERRAWTAVFDSYDQRHDDVYYVLTVREQGREVARFMAQTWVQGDDWTTTAFLDDLRDQLHQVAVTGATNTRYTGAMGPWTDPG
jgi:hypothetical protein